MTLSTVVSEYVLIVHKLQAEKLTCTSFFSFPGEKRVLMYMNDL